MSNQKLKKFIKYFLPNQDHFYDCETEQAIYLVKSVGLATVTLIFHSLLYFYFDLDNINQASILNIIALLFSILLFKKTSHYNLSLTIAVLSTVSNLIYAMSYTGGIHSPIGLYFSSITVYIMSGLSYKKSIRLLKFIAFIVFVFIATDHYTHFSRNDLNKDQQEFLQIFVMFGSMGLTGFLTTAFITEIYGQKVEVFKQNVQLKKLLEEKRNLVRILSHDMANPLAVVTSRTALAKKLTKQEDKLLESLTAIERATANLLRIGDQVRLMEGIETGKTDFLFSKVDLNQVIDDCHFIFEDRLKNKDLQLEFTAENPKDLFIIAEKDSFSNIVINNLISNAIKFSKRGDKIKIDVTSHKTEKDYIWLKVSDQGIGIPQNILLSLFKTDIKTTRSGTEGEKGTGFGMPLVKNYLNVIGGKINVESKTIDESPNDHGTTFILKLKKAT